MRTYERSWWWVKEKKQMALVFITITMILQMKGCVGCVEIERIGLLQLKSYLNSLLTPEEASILESWSDDDRSSDCCLWERVNCSDTIGGHIVDLSLDQLMPYTYYVQPPLRSLNLSLLHSFPRLKTVDFSFNMFSDLFDPINGYKSFQRLEKLRTLDFSENRLNNSVLHFLSAVRSLRTLNLGGNLLEGVFPPNELANMTELRVLSLRSNGFTSFSVQGLINLRELQVLELDYNRINDVEAGHGLRTTNLKSLDLSSNKFSDNARLKGLENLVELEVLNLAVNEFNHTRSVEVLKDMSKLQELHLSSNKFIDLDSLILVFPSSLQVLDLSSNYLSLTHKDMPKLQQLDLSGNEFTDLDSLGVVLPSSLQVLDLAFNQLSSTHKGYSDICALMNLRELDLSYNTFTSLPYCLGNLSNLRTLDLSDNQLNENFSSFVYGLPSVLEYLSLLGNNFNGSFLFNSLANKSSLKVFELSSRVGMIQAVENSWVPMFQLKKLTLQNFSLDSTIPGFLIHQHELFSVDLSRNNLTGAFLTWLLQNNTRLQTLLLNSNSMTELQLPRLVHGLQFLDIWSNRIYDSIQENIGIVFPKLRVMDFSSNHFHGTIPSSMGHMKSLRLLDVSTNGLFGQLPKTFLSGCYSMEFLKLSNNQFHGIVFSEHANLTSLEWLFLDGNSFNGSLGKGLLNSKKLYLLDISNDSIWHASTLDW